MANPNGHNAAVLLATPGFSKQLEDESFLRGFAKLMSASAEVDQFHVLGAIVDHIAPPVGSYQPFQGITVLRGHLDDTLPHLWQPEPPKSIDDADTVSALTFSLGIPSVTLPLARTTFYNNRNSTLLTSQFDMNRGAPKLVKQTEKHSQRVMLSLNEPPQAMADLGIQAPLVPLTQPRVVMESFGNIIRGIEVDGKLIPASTELEHAVDLLYKHNATTGIMSGPVGVWAVITPQANASSEVNEWLENMPNTLSASQNIEDVKTLVQETALHLRQLYSRGGRLYKIRM